MNTSVPPSTTVNIPSYGGTSNDQIPLTFNTLDEPVSTTLMRDLKAIYNKIVMVMFPVANRKNILREWDLWGPLLLCLALSIRLSMTAPSEQSTTVFTGVFVVIWCGAGMVTVNSRLLGGKISFFQSVCVLGYCAFPLVVSAFIALFFPLIILRGIVCGIAFAWSLTAAMGFLSDAQLDNRRLLALYPMGLFYFVIAWMILISKSLFDKS